MAGARATVVLALTLLLTGGLFELPTLYVPAIALGLLALGALTWVGLAARGARVRPLPGPSTIEEGKPYPLHLSLDWGWAPPPGGELRHAALNDPVPVGLGAPSEVVAELRFHRWGPQEVDPAILSIHDPIHLHRRELEGSAGPRVLVLPRIEPVLAPAEGNGGAPGETAGWVGSRATGRSRQPVDPEIDGLRPWRPGVPASRIHWPSLARTGELLERSLTGGGDSSPLVVLDPGTGAEQESLLRVVRAAASLCLHLARAGGCSLLLPGESTVHGIDRTLRSWPRVHTRLAFVEPEQRPVDPPAGASTIFWVTAEGTPAPGRVRQREGYFVTPAEVPGAQPAFRVAGCRGFSLSSATRALAASGMGAVARTA
jgi:uncharacterized protein (DUF58 family)